MTDKTIRRGAVLLDFFCLVGSGRATRQARQPAIKMDAAPRSMDRNHAGQAKGTQPVIKKKTDAASVDAAIPDATASNATPALTAPHATTPVATPFSELPPDLAKTIGDAIAANGWRPWDELDPEVRHAVLHLVDEQADIDHWAAQRRAEGRSTIAEAIRLIVRHEAARAFASDPKAEKWQTYWDLERLIGPRLIAAVKAGEIRVYRARRWVDDAADDSRWLTREAYWNDLDNWLAANLPRVEFRFSSLRRDVGDAGVAPAAANTPSAAPETSAPGADPSTTTPTSRDDRTPEPVIDPLMRYADARAALKRYPNLTPLLKQYDLADSLKRYAAERGVSVEELETMLGAPMRPIPRSWMDALATDPCFRTPVRMPVGAEAFFRSRSETVTPIASNAPTEAGTTGVGAPADHGAAPAAANTVAGNSTPWKKGGEARAAKYRAVGDYALQRANAGTYRSRRQAVKAIAPDVLSYAKKNGITLTEANLERSIDQWLTTRGYNPRASKRGT